MIRLFFRPDKQINSHYAINFQNTKTVFSAQQMILFLSLLMTIGEPII